MHSKFGNSRFGALVVVLIALLPVTLAAHVPSPAKADPARRVAVNFKAPRFTLIDQDGKPFISESRLRGKVVAINFIYTTCSDVCPLFTVEFARLQRALKSQSRQDFLLVSITTDPEIDSPKVLKAYAQRFDADLQNWAFLTGNESQMKEVWQAFGVKVIRKDRGLVQHSSLTTLIDTQGTRRINFFGSKWQADHLLKDMRALNEIGR
ncbi:MAG: redoxin domain-containing protein [Deltaproteobacteria bacterium]|nr:redoxin domain-containing protein [Deltaproteobacteria bacterium]